MLTKSEEFKLTLLGFGGKHIVRKEWISYSSKNIRVYLNKPKGEQLSYLLIDESPDDELSVYNHWRRHLWEGKKSINHIIRIVDKYNANQ